MTVSKKLQEHIENPKFFESKHSKRNELSVDFQWGENSYFLNLSATLGADGVFNDLYFYSDVQGIGLGILDGIIELTNQKEFFFCSLIQDRELENYLRDQNHQVAFVLEDFEKNQSVSLLLRTVKKSLSKILARDLLKKIEQTAKCSQLEKFNQVDLITRMAMLEDVRNLVLIPLIKPFEMDLRFTELWQNELYFQLKLPSHRENNSLRKFIRGVYQELFRMHSGLETLNWVAEPV